MDKRDISIFLRLAETIPVVDVRSPGEYSAGHMPGAINIPLFNNEERAIVGTSYTREGRIQAILKGLQHTGPTMHLKLHQALATASQDNLLVHCWRGGMRSEAMAWLFSLGGINTQILNGGYKAYRNHVLASLSEKRKIFILGGMTGSGKTNILASLKRRGEQVIDLEGLAHHKGSAFGSLGQPPQPSTEQFANDLHAEWSRLDPERPVWLEDESRNIGTVFMPPEFYSIMQKSATVVLMMDISTRMPRLLSEYAGYDPALLISSLEKISRRMGGDNTREAIMAVERGDIAAAIEISLRYYDKTYLYSIKRKNNPGTIYVKTDTDDVDVNAGKVMEAVMK